MLAIGSDSKPFWDVFPPGNSKKFGIVFARGNKLKEITFFQI
jgi:hypothetical protein